jgi:preprotein translocase SecE subunit
MAKKEKSEAAEKIAKAEKASKAKKNKSGQENPFARAGKAVGRYLKDFRGELRKIVWPDRKTVLKSIGVVLAVIAVIGVIIFLIDTGLAEIVQLLSRTATNYHDKAKEVTEALPEVTQAITEATQAVTEAITDAVTTTGG